LSCFVGQPLAFDASERDLRPLHIVDTKLGASVLPKVELGQITLKMLGVDVLINADDTALEYRKEPFKRIGVNVAPHPFEFVVIDALMLGGLEFEMGGLVGHEAAIRVQMLPQARADTAMVDDKRADRAAALDKAENLGVMSAAAEASGTLGFARPRQFGFIGIDGLAFVSAVSIPPFPDVADRRVF
jgi:hypothetical protein